MVKGRTLTVPWLRKLKNNMQKLEQSIKHAVESGQAIKEEQIYEFAKQRIQGQINYDRVAHPTKPRFNK